MSREAHVTREQLQQHTDYWTGLATQARRNGDWSTLTVAILTLNMITAAWCRCFIGEAKGAPP
jgi:TorA maturation chaperone TorD